MKILRKKFPNGLTLLTVPLKESQTVTVLVMVRAGTKYETKKENGISHFLEHLCFKGTKSRPSSKDIAYELDSMGAQNNAFTWYEFTGYWAKANHKHLAKLTDIISDIYLNPIFPEAEIEKEKGVILEEMNLYEDRPESKVRTIYSSLLYGDQPAGWTILGEKRFIQKAKREDFVRYRKNHYLPKSTIVVIAGNINEKTASSTVSKYFSLMSKGKYKNKKKVTLSQTSPRIKVMYKNTEQAHLVIGVRAFPAKDNRNVTVKVIDSILGGGMSSRLFQKLREEMGVCYYVGTVQTEFTDHGEFGVSAGVTNERVREVFGAILGEFEKLRKEKVSLKELEKAKEYLVGNLVMNLETSEYLADFVGIQEVLLGKTKNISTIEKEIRSVTADDVQKVSRQIFKDSGLNAAIVGRISKKGNLKSILKIRS